MTKPADNEHRLRVPVGPEDWVRGRTDAPVTMVEYLDFQCPHCQAAFPEVEETIWQAGEKLRYVARHFPLSSVHLQAQAAACAAEAAGKQGKFWEMYRKLFESHGQLNDANIQKYAQELGLDMARFIQDAKSEDTLTRIRLMKMAGARSGVNGTPTFFINGLRYDGEPSAEDLLAAINQAAADAGKHA
jgi:protein-disulfide isomerase